MKNYEKGINLEVQLIGTNRYLDGLLHIRTRYVRNKIRGMKFSLSAIEYITNMMSLEEWILDGAQCFADAMGKRYLIHRYWKEYRRIYTELYSYGFNGKREDYKSICRGVDYHEVIYRGSKYYELIRSQWKGFGGVL